MILYAWTGVFAFGAVALAFLPVIPVLIAIGAVVILGIVLSLVPLPVRRARPSLTP